MDATKLSPLSFSFAASSADCGNDTVTFNGSESSIDGGAGSDTLVLAASASVTALSMPPLLPRMAFVKPILKK